MVLVVGLDVHLNVGKVSNPPRYSLYGATLRVWVVTYYLLTLFKLSPRKAKGSVGNNTERGGESVLEI